MEPEDVQAWHALGAELAALRRRVAALDLPDEGMRGTAADGEKARAAEDSEALDLLAVGLRSCGEIAANVPRHAQMEHAAAAAAIVRSIALTPAAASRVVCHLGSDLVEAVKAVRANSGPSEAQRRALAWLLPAVMRLAQHRECHEALLRRGSLPVLHSLLAAEAQVSDVRDTWQGYGSDDGRPYGGGGDDMRLDLVACIALGFLSESSPALAALVPTRAVASLVVLLQLRLDAPAGFAAAEELVRRRGFLGLPMYFRPRFVLQALRWLCAHSAAHAAAARATALPSLLADLLRGALPNDAPDNLPFGTEDAVAVGRPLADILDDTGSAQPSEPHETGSAQHAASTRKRARSPEAEPPRDDASVWCMCTDRGGGAVLTGASITTERHGAVGERPEVRFIGAIEDTAYGTDDTNVSLGPERSEGAAPLPTTLYLRSRLGGRSFCAELLSTAAWDALPEQERQARLAQERRSWPDADMAAVRRASTFELSHSCTPRPWLRRVELSFYACGWGLQRGTIELALRPLDNAPIAPAVPEGRFSRVQALPWRDVLPITWDTMRERGVNPVFAS